MAKSNKGHSTLEAKLDKMVDKISSIDVTLAHQAEQLSYHIKRTDLLEARIRPLEFLFARILGAIVGISSLITIASAVFKFWKG